jgi:hypothetical protein
MVTPLADRIVKKIGQTVGLYYRLIFLAAPAGAGKTAALQDVHEYTGAPLLNVNLELSRRMLELTERQRVLQLPRLLTEMVTNPEDRRFERPRLAREEEPGRPSTNASWVDVVLLDNIEVLFDVALKQDPLRMLQGLSRNKTVVAAWNGSVDHENMIYATPDHPEYKRYPFRDFLVVNSDVG